MWHEYFFGCVSGGCDIPNFHECVVWVCVESDIVYALGWSGFYEQLQGVPTRCSLVILGYKYRCG